MDYIIRKRMPCSVCGLDTFRHKGWFLVVENRWLDRLKILSWHPSLAGQKDVKSVCCRQHLKTLVVHWLTQASLRVSPVHLLPPMPIGSDPDQNDIDFGQDGVGRIVGELSVHRESFSRVWSGSPQSLECILDALITVGTEIKPEPLEVQLLAPPASPYELSLQSGAGRV